jgi:hypothetical protein
MALSIETIKGYAINLLFEIPVGIKSGKQSITLENDNVAEIWRLWINKKFLT